MISNLVAVLGLSLYCVFALPSNQNPSTNHAENGITQLTNSSAGLRHCGRLGSTCSVASDNCCAGYACQALDGSSSVGTCVESCSPYGSTKCGPYNPFPCCEGLICGGDPSSPSRKICCSDKFTPCIPGKQECCLGLQCTAAAGCTEGHCRKPE